MESNRGSFRADRFTIMAHRCGPRYAPENTLAAMRTSTEYGARAVETDLRRTKDGVTVLFHDETLDRVTDAEGRIEDHTYDELRRLDAGSYLAAEFAGCTTRVSSSSIQVSPT